MSELGLSAVELGHIWNDTLRQLHCVFSEPQLPAGMDVEEAKRNPNVLRVPETDTAVYPTYKAYVDFAATILSLIDKNNRRIEQQLRAAGVVISP